MQLPQGPSTNKELSRRSEPQAQEYQETRKPLPKALLSREKDVVSALTQDGSEGHFDFLANELCAQGEFHESQMSVERERVHWNSPIS